MLKIKNLIGLFIIIFAFGIAVIGCGDASTGTVEDIGLYYSSETADYSIVGNKLILSGINLNGTPYLDIYTRK